MLYSGLVSLCSALVLGSVASGYIVPIHDTDQLRETCSGMFGGEEAFIEVSFNPSSSGQVSLIIYEWNDVKYLGVDTPDNSVGGVIRPVRNLEWAGADEKKTYICTTSAVRSGLCTSSQLGGFITTLPDGMRLNETSIYTEPLKFSPDSFPTNPPLQSEPIPDVGDGEVGGEGDDDVDNGSGDGDGGAPGDPEEKEEKEEEGILEDEESPPWITDDRRLGRRQWDIIDSITSGVKGASTSKPDDGSTGSDSTDSPERQDEEGGGEGNGDGNTVYEVPTYSGAIHYKVPKTGYYCVGIVPVTLLNQRSLPTPSSASASVLDLEKRQANHAEYSGFVLFKSTFDGELPAVEYPKINFYLVLSVIYFGFGCFWGWLCYKHLSELLPMQYYISGTIIFLIIEMLAQFAYYRYINKHGGGTSSLVFLFVIAILNAARNSLSFFLLLIVCMGLSVVTQSLGGVMGRVRLLTGFHFVFGVMYSVGTVEVELDNAPLWIVLLLIFPLALTLTAFLMWIILSLNGTILHLQQRKQRYKLQMFQHLWRILIMAVIAIAAFFVVSSLSLSNRLEEDYAPRNWRYRWILLDGSLALIYLMVFIAVAWLWRPTRDNVRFAMSQELAQDEGEADAEDYEIDNLEGRSRRLSDEEEGGGDGYSTIESDARSLKTLGSMKGRGGGGGGEVTEENVVFAMGDDSDSDEDGDRDGKGYKDVERRMRDDSPQRRSGDEGKGEGLVKGSGSRAD